MNLFSSIKNNGFTTSKAFSLDNFSICLTVSSSHSFEISFAKIIKFVETIEGKISDLYRKEYSLYFFTRSVTKSISFCVLIIFFNHFCFSLTLTHLQHYCMNLTNCRINFLDNIQLYYMNHK